MGFEGEHPVQPWAGEPGVVCEVFDGVPIMLVGLEGRDLRFVAANRAYREFVGRSKLMGVPVREVFPEVEGQRLFELFERVYATGAAQTAREWRVQLALSPGGQPQEAFFDFTIAPWRRPTGEVRGVFTYLTDVTERVRARQAAQVLAAEAEQRFQEARDVVAALQEVLLATGLPVLPQARIGARYLVAAADQAAGGDWFDAIGVSEGRVALVVGDVVGHGVAASAAMGQLRAVLSDQLVTGPDLATVLAHVDGFAARTPALRAATLCVVVLDPATGQMLYTCCGHPPPLVLGADGKSRYLPGTGTGPLGTGSPPALAMAALAEGEVVFLYSDGLIERPGRTLDEGMAELAAVAADAAANRVLPIGAASTPAERVCQLSVELLTRSGYADDVTALAAERLGAPFKPLVLELRAELASVTKTRKLLTRWLDDLDTAADDRRIIELAACEAVTNAVEHAYPAGKRGLIRFEAVLKPNGNLEIRISDRGNWRQPDPAVTNRGHGLFVIGQLVDELLVSHPPQGPAAPPGARGTTVTMRHRLHRPATLAFNTSAMPADHPARQPFSTRTVTSGPIPSVRVTGPVDITTTERFTHALLAACRGGVLSLTVDLAAVTIMASTGVQALHDLTDQLAAHQRDLILIAPPGSPAAVVLDLAGLPRITGRGDGAPPGQQPDLPATPR